jgi:hypothetical protein
VGQPKRLSPHQEMGVATAPTSRAKMVASIMSALVQRRPAGLLRPADATGHITDAGDYAGVASRVSEVRPRSAGITCVAKSSMLLTVR